MKNIIFAILSATFALTVISCGDEEDGDSAAEETTMPETIDALCVMLADCEETADTYTLTGGTPEGCATAVTQFMFADCEPFDAVVATDCVDETEAMACPDFAAMIDAVMIGAGSMPESCQTMCGE